MTFIQHIQQTGFLHKEIFGPYCVKTEEHFSKVILISVNNTALLKPNTQKDTVTFQVFIVQEC